MNTLTLSTSEPAKLQTPTALLGAIAAVLLASLPAPAAKFHKKYLDSGGFITDTQLKSQLVATTNAFFTALDNGDGLLLVRTDLDGNVVWSHQYGDYRIKAPTLTLSNDGHLIAVAWSLDDLDAIAAKINATTGDVVWSQRYPGMNEAFTVTRRGSRLILMGEKTFTNPPGDYLVKPMAIAIRESDGSVVWAKEYQEGTIDYLENFNHRIEAATVNPGTVTYTGRFYDAALDPHGPDRRRVSLLTIDASTGLVPLNAMHTYDLELTANDYAIETDSPFPWDITRIKDAQGNDDGFALAGTYSHSDTYAFNATDPVVLRVDQNGTPLWAMLYGSTNTFKGFGRSLRQNVYFNAGRLDLYTTWDQYTHAIDASSTVSGIIRIQEVDGLPVGMAVYDAPDADFSGLCMTADGTGGYLAVAAEPVSPYSSFELLRVGQIGGGVDCYVDHPLELEELIVDDDVVEIVPLDVDVEPREFPLTWVDRPLTVTECDE